MHPTHQLFTPSEALSRLGDSRAKGCLVVVSSTEVVQIFVKDAEISHASNGKMEGEDAIKIALELTNTSYTWIPGAEPAKKTLDINIQAFALKNAVAYDIRMKDTGKVKINEQKTEFKTNPRYYLEAEEIPGKKLTLKKLTTIVGRDNGCDIILEDIRISRRHCLFELMSRGLHFRDLESTNGVMINGIPATEGFLNPGDHLYFGTYRLTIRKEREPSQRLKRLPKLS